MIWRFALSVAVVVLASSPSAQSTPDVDAVLTRIGTYLVGYEAQLSSVVADESFDQRLNRAGLDQHVLESRDRQITK